MHYLLALTFILAPAYTIRFNLFVFPTNLLMVWVFLFWVIFSCWLIANKKILSFLLLLKSFEKKFLIFSTIFFISGILGLFFGGFDRIKLGQFIVLFFQPIITFFIAKYIIEQEPKTKGLLLTTCYLLLAAAGLLSIIQYFTLIGLPTEFWGNNVEPKRAVAFFTHPNFYALWAALLLGFLIPDLGSILQTKNYKLKTFLWVLGSIGLLLSLSRAGWLGLASAAGIYLIVAATKKLRKLSAIIVIVMFIIILITPNLRYRFLLPFYGEKSTVSRFSLWHTGIKGIQESPIFGLGLNGFSKNWPTLNTDPNLDTHNYPHNIFLDTWVTTGILGLISFIIICYLTIQGGFKNRQDIFKLGVALFLIALLTQGQIDNPYFKNDLALVFWIIIALI